MSHSFVERPEDLPSMAQLTSMSGLDFILGMIAGDIPGPPIAQSLGFRLQSAEDGQAVFRGKPEFRVMNPMGAVHGGWYGTILDSAMGCAVMTKVPKGQVYTTLEYKVNIVRAVPLGLDTLTVGRVRHSGRSTAVADGEILGAEDGKLYATGSTTCIILNPGR